jgi:hypothetical protein
MPALLLVLSEYKRHPSSVDTIAGHVDKKRIRVASEAMEY